MSDSNKEALKRRFVEDDPDTLIWNEESKPLSKKETDYKKKLLEDLELRKKQ